MPIHWTVYAAEPEIQGSLVNIPQTPETIAAQNPPQPRPDTNHPPIVRRDLPDITAEVGDGLKIDMRNYFLDPEKNTISFTAVVDADAPLPEGMQMQNDGSWLYGRPEMPGEYEITVTATDISEPPGQSETARQTFTLYVLHEDPRIVNVIDEQLSNIPDHLLDFDNRMIGSPIHIDIFDITANVEVETIGEFVQN